MSYKAKTIFEIIENIYERKMYMPALQRKFVWSRHQIEILFDSLVRGFPFGSFLFWKLKNTDAENYIFYDFISNFDEFDPYNKKSNTSLPNEIIGVLDGQQRLTSLYIGLMGSFNEKKPHKPYKDPNSYQKKFLCINLLSLPIEINLKGDFEIIEDKNFEFQFRTEDDSKKTSRILTNDDGVEIGNEPMFWMDVRQVMNWRGRLSFKTSIDKFKNQCSTEEQKKSIELNRDKIDYLLHIFYIKIHSEELVNYFQIEKSELEDVLKIFVRVNSGGTVLNKTDLLFSTIVATWMDGRKKIEDFQKKINSMGEGFRFNTEYLMRSTLVLRNMFKTPSNPGWCEWSGAGTITA